MTDPVLRLIERQCCHEGNSTDEHQHNITIPTCLSAQNAKTHCQRCGGYPFDEACQHLLGQRLRPLAITSSTVQLRLARTASPNIHDPCPTTQSRLLRTMPAATPAPKRANGPRTGASSQPRSSVVATIRISKTPGLGRNAHSKKARCDCGP